jgi:ABC-2 type transport system ATP-binding protein
VGDRQDVPVVANALTAIGDSDALIDESTGRVAVVVGGGTEQLSRVLRSLEQAAITLDDVALRPPRLDEAFLELTGQALPEESAEDRVAAAPSAGSQPQPALREETRHG